MARKIKAFAVATPRDIVKTISFAMLHFAVAFAVAYALTGSLTIATGIGLIEPLVNTLAFYFHEKVWESPHRNRSAPVPLSRSV
jgi:uncharacterized membrane protein